MTSLHTPFIRPFFIGLLSFVMVAPSLLFAQEVTEPEEEVAVETHPLVDQNNNHQSVFLQVRRTDGL